MKIAILGTKGVPNNYGGFEQFAEYLSVGLTEMGHSVTVYNPSYHPYKEASFKGVTILRAYSPEKFLGGAANFIYDYLCLKDALTRDFDIIYEAGYHSVAFFYWTLGMKKRKSPVLLTNMDGLEWKRQKWNFLTRKLIKRLEIIAVRNSPYLVSDNVGIQEYYKTVFNRDSFCLPYGATIPANYDQSLLGKYGVEHADYFVLIARMEPENNIEQIVRGFCSSSSKTKLIVVGGLNKFGTMIREKYKDERLVFTGGIYDKAALDSLRYFSAGYFHGHSVGGTNPSLLEAMACECFIMAHDNPFNKAVLGEAASYFSQPEHITAWVDSVKQIPQATVNRNKSENLSRIRTQYNWPQIIKDHEVLFEKLMVEKPTI